MNWPAYGFGLAIGSRTDKCSIQTKHHINLLQYVKLQEDHKHSTPYTGMLYWWKLTYKIFSEVWQVPSGTPCVHVITLSHDKCQYTVQRLSGDCVTVLGCLDFSASYCASTEFICQGQRVIFSKVGTKFLYTIWINFMLETFNNHPDFITVTVITLMTIVIKTMHVLECSLELKIQKPNSVAL